MIQPPLQKLVLHDIRLPVVLGWYPEERQHTQEVRLDITIRFAHNTATVSDELAHTVCYTELITRLKGALSAKSFKLIEHACYACYHMIKSYIDNAISVTLTKLIIPIEHLHGGAAYTCSDF